MSARHVSFETLHPLQAGKLRVSSRFHRLWYIIFIRFALLAPRQISLHVPGERLVFDRSESFKHRRDWSAGLFTFHELLLRHHKLSLVDLPLIIIDERKLLLLFRLAINAILLLFLELVHVLSEIYLIELLGMKLGCLQVIGNREFLICKSSLPE